MTWVVLCTLLGQASTELTETVGLSAEQVVHQGERDVTVAEGHAKLTARDTALDADQIVFSRRERKITASGHVALRLVQRGLIAVTADAVVIDLDGDEVREVSFLDGTAVRKKDLSAAELLAIGDPDALNAAGKSAMALSGNHLVRDGDNWVVDQVDLAPCDCDVLHPSWFVRAHQASFDLQNERVSAWSPTFFIKDVPLLHTDLPVFWLPWLSLPLSARQTGFLIPQPKFSPLSGFELETPLFVVLGESADVTFTPIYYFGRPGPLGVKGPQLLTELRYTPSLTTRGRATFGALWDLNANRSPVDPNVSLGGQRGPRFEGSLQHAQELGHGVSLRADGSFVSDGYYLRDLVADVLMREAGYLRSTASVYHRSDQQLAGLDVVLRQDLSWGYPVFGDAPPLSGVPVFGPNPLHRLPALRWALAETPFAGPLSFAMQAELVRLAPWHGQSGDEGGAANEGLALVGSQPISTACQHERLYYAGTPTGACGPLAATAEERAQQGDHLYQPGERPARTRLTFFPRVGAQVPLGEVLHLSLWSAFREALWLNEISGRVSHAGHTIIAARADSELYRDFFDGAVRHSISPSLEVRAFPLSVGEPYAPYDEVDFAIAMPSSVQLLGVLRQRLSHRGSGDDLALELGQGAELTGSDARLGESYARLRAHRGWFSLQSSAFADFPSAQWSRISASAALDNGAGRSVHLGYENVADEGSALMRQSIDALVGPKALGLSRGRSQLVSAGAHFRWALGNLGALGLGYETLFLPRSFGTAEANHSALALVQHSASVVLEGACGCWALDVAATQRIREDRLYVSPAYEALQWRVGFTLSGFRAGQ